MSKTIVKNQRTVDDFVKSMKEASGSYVAIGLHSDAGQYPDGTSVVQVGLWNEFGTENIPERAWMRSTIDENMEQLNQMRDKLLGEVTEGKTTVKHALEQLGFRIQTLLQNKIKSNMPPPNAPSTVEHKRHEGVAPRTLIETGLLLRSVTYKVYNA